VDEFNTVDIKVSETQKPPFGLKMETFNLDFFVFHIDEIILQISKKGDNTLGGKEYIKSLDKKRMFDTLRREQNEISEKEGRIIIDKEQINLNIDFLDFEVYKNIIGKLREGVSYFPILIDPLLYYPTICKKRTKYTQPNNTELTKEKLKIIYTRLEHIWNNLKYFGGKGLVFDKKDIIICQKDNPTEIDVFVIDFLNFKY
jgi:hypothetical protein